MGTKRETAVEEIDTEEGFERVRLADVADVVRGVTYKKDDATEKPTKGLIPILRANNIQDGTLELEGELVYVPRDSVSDDQVLRKGDIVIATSSGSKDLVGKAAPMREDWHGSFGAFCAVVRPRKEIHPLYLVHFLGSPEYKDLIRDKALGVNINNLRRGDLEELQIPLAPLPEQRRIVSAIETQLGRLDAAVKRLHAAKAKLKRYKQAVLKAAVEGALLYPDLAEGELPESWSIVRLADLVTEGPSNGYSPKPTKDQEGTKSLKLSATTSGRMILNEDTIKYIPEVVPRASKYWLRKGDVLLQRANSLEYLGSAAMYEGPEYEYIYPDLMMRVRLENELLARYLVYFLNSTTARNYFIKRATGTAGNMPKINGETVRELEVPVPPPNDLRQVLQAVDDLSNQTAAMDATLDAQLLQSTRLRQAVLKRAFEGRLV